VMHFFSDLSYNQIAETLGTTRATVAVLIFRGKQKFATNPVRVPCRLQGNPKGTDPRRRVLRGLEPESICGGALQAVLANRRTNARLAYDRVALNMAKPPPACAAPTSRKS